jgi:tetratricopeptide (TPR) repeat protein
MTEKNSPEAFKWFGKAAEQDNKESQLYLGCYYLYGDDQITQDMEKAEHWLSKAANAGEPRAQYHLARFYYNPSYGKQRPGDVMHWLKKAADQGERRAMSMYADIHLTHFYPDVKKETAVEYYTKLIEVSGDYQDELVLNAMLTLGTLLCKEEKNLRDVAKGLAYYEKCMKSGKDSFDAWAITSKHFNLPGSYGGRIESEWTSHIKQNKTLEGFSHWALSDSRPPNIDNAIRDMKDLETGMLLFTRIFHHCLDEGSQESIDLLKKCTERIFVNWTHSLALQRSNLVRMRNKDSDISIMLEEHGGAAEEVWTTTRFIVEDGIVSLFMHDFGSRVEAHFGTDEYEKTLELSGIDSETFIENIGIRGKEREEVKEILLKRLKDEHGDYVSGFQALCQSWGLRISASSWY